MRMFTRRVLHEVTCGTLRGSELAWRQGEQWDQLVSLGSVPMGPSPHAGPLLPPRNHAVVAALPFYTGHGQRPWRAADTSYVCAGMCIHMHTCPCMCQCSNGKLGLPRDSEGGESGLPLAHRNLGVTSQTLLQRPPPEAVEEDPLCPDPHCFRGTGGRYSGFPEGPAANVIGVIL